MEILSSLGQFLFWGIVDNTGGNAQAAADAADAVAASPMDSFLSIVPVILIYGGVIFALYWFMFRPQRKREKEMQALRASIKTGDNVVTSSGFYGKVVDTTTETFVIEFGTNKGIRIPVRKHDVIGLASPDNIPVSKESTEK